MLLCHSDFYDVWKYQTMHLQQAYSEDAMGHTQVFDWFRWFKEGRTSVESNSAQDDHQHWETRKWSLKLTVVRNNGRLTVWEIADDCGISVGSCDAILTRKLAGWRLDPASRQCTRTHFTSCAAVFGQTWHRSVATAAILTRSRTVWLFPIPKV